MAEVSIESLLQFLLGQTQSLINEFQSLLKGRIAELNFSQNILPLAKEVSKKWVAWNPNDCDDVFDMNRECSVLIVQFHTVIRRNLYESEHMYALTNDSDYRDRIYECSDIIDEIDKILSEYSFKL